jgi:Uma2 family endonuclease
MTSALKKLTLSPNDYPTTDGRPMAETDWHRTLMTNLIQTLTAFFLATPRVYVTGNLMLFYEQGNRRRHVAPDVFVVKGVSKELRPNYLLWEEGKSPDFVVELTSATTQREDVEQKFVLYRDVLRVKEYFLFDPYEDYLEPSLQGYRLRAGEYRPIRMVEGRLPSRVLGLHLERVGRELRFYDPLTGERLPTLLEALDHERAEKEQERAEKEQERAEKEQERAEKEREQAGRLLAEAENERLRQELEELRRRAGQP